MDEEFRIDQMIAQGKTIMQEAMAGHKIAAIVAAFSGGDDSIVATHFTMANYPGAVAASANTLVGLGPAVAHRRAVCEAQKWDSVEECAVPEGPPKRMRQNGKLVPFDFGIFPTGKWTDGETAYEESVLNHGFPGRGAKQHQRMYQRLKERCFQRIIRRLGGNTKKDGKRVVFVSGIRGDESSIRAGYKRAWKLGYFGDLWINPFYYQSKADFALYRDEFGLRDNPVKKLCGISGECCCGTFPSPNERESYEIADPAFVRYLEGLEKRVTENGFPWGWGESPPSWWVKEQEEKKSGQLRMFQDDDEIRTFQPACVGCLSGRK